MSSRALRRLQKAELDELAKHDSSEEEDTAERPAKVENLFNLLDIGDDENDEDNDGPENQEDQEEHEECHELDPKPVTFKSTPPKSKKKNKKNKGKKDSAKKNTAEISMDELDKIIQQVDTKRSTATTSEADNSHDNTERHRALLSVNIRMLDAEAEMKRMFGSRVVEHTKRATGRVLKQSRLTTPKPEWPPYKKQGLSMELLETKSGISHYSFKHLEQYQDTQLEFLNATAMLDPNILMHLTRLHPYQVDTLLQLSEVAKHQGDMTVAGDLIERALFACEKAFHIHFKLDSGAVRLSYKRSENRSFFLAVSRHIQFLERRGCWQTAFEFNKLLFSLDPVADPLCALLSLDYSAIMAREYNYVLQLVSDWKTDGKTFAKDLDQFPNFVFSAAYCKRRLAPKESSDSESECSTMLRAAIQKFPGVVSRLLIKLGETDLVMEPIDETNPLLDLLQQLFVEHCWELWKEPEIIQWFKENARIVAQGSLEETSQIEWKESISLNVSRHVIVADIQSLLSYLPRKVTEAGYQMYDPLPPTDSTTGYDINDRLRANRSSGLNGFGSGERGIPAMLQDLLQGFPGVTLQQLRELGQQRLPGGFPGDELEDSESDDQEGLEDQEGEETAEDAALQEQEDLDFQRALAESMNQH